MRTFLVVLFILALAFLVGGIAGLVMARTVQGQILAALAAGFGALTVAATGAAALAEDHAEKTLALLRSIRDRAP